MNILGEILLAFRFGGTLNRLPFAAGFFGLAATIAYSSFIVRQHWISVEDGGLTYVSVAWATEILIAIIVLPLCAARLRDIEWPAILSMLILITPALSPKLLVIISLVNGGTFSAPHWALHAISALGIGLAIGLLLLFLKRGRTQATDES